MKTKKLSTLLLPIIVLTVIFLSSCEDDDKKSPVNDPAKKENAAKVLAFREEMSFVNRFVDEQIPDMSSDGGRKSFTSATISRIKNFAPCAEATEEELPDGSIKITLDFGDGCETEEGLELGGSVIMIFSFTDTTISYELEFIDYSELSGENQGEVVNGTVNGSLLVDLQASKFIQEMEQDLTIQYPNNTEAGYRLAQKAELTENGLRVVEFTTSGNFANGAEFAATIRKTLVYDFSCEGDLPVQGEELLTFQGNTILINYGNGTCDNDYTVK